MLLYGKIFSFIFERRKHTHTHTHPPIHAHAHSSSRFPKLDAVHVEERSEQEQKRERAKNGPAQVYIRNFTLLPVRIDKSLMAALQVQK